MFAVRVIIILKPLVHETLKDTFFLVEIQLRNFPYNTRTLGNYILKTLGSITYKWTQYLVVVP